MATTSALSVFTLATMRCKKACLMVGPTCMSLICASIKPCSATGKPAIGTSTRTIAGVRRAFKNPKAVINKANNGVAMPESERKLFSGSANTNASTAQATSSKTSRNAVNTNSDENNPISSSPTQLKRSAHGWRATRLPNRPSGIKTADKSRPAPITQPQSADNSGTRRQPTKACNNATIKTSG